MFPHHCIITLQKEGDIVKTKSIFGGMSGLNQQQYYDMQKRQYCKKHGIKLVIIPYWDEYQISYDYIMNLADVY